MKGLLIKDFLYLKQLAKGIIILIIIFAAFAAMSDGANKMGGVIGGFLIGLMFVLVINSFASDEKSKWDIYAFSMPVSKKQIVFERYVFMLIIMACTAVVGYAMCCVSQRGVQTESFKTISDCAAYALVFFSVMLPLIYKFGLQKAKLIIIIGCFLSMFLPMLQAIIKAILKDKTAGGMQMPHMVPLLPVLLIACVAVSYMISYRIVKNKDI